MLMLLQLLYVSLLLLCCCFCAAAAVVAAAVAVDAVAVAVAVLLPPYRCCRFCWRAASVVWQGCEKEFCFLCFPLKFGEPKSGVFCFPLIFGWKKLLWCIFARSARRNWCTPFTGTIGENCARSARKRFLGVFKKHVLRINSFFLSIAWTAFSFWTFFFLKCEGKYCFTFIYKIHSIFLCSFSFSKKQRDDSQQSARSV